MYDWFSEEEMARIAFFRRREESLEIFNQCVVLTLLKIMQERWGPAYRDMQTTGFLREFDRMKSQAEVLSKHLKRLRRDAMLEIARQYHRQMRTLFPREADAEEVIRSLDARMFEEFGLFAC